MKEFYYLVAPRVEVVLVAQEANRFEVWLLLHAPGKEVQHTAKLGAGSYSQAIRCLVDAYFTLDEAFAPEETAPTPERGPSAPVKH
jgi:hypothetical protein